MLKTNMLDDGRRKGAVRHSPENARRRRLRQVLRFFILIVAAFLLAAKGRGVLDIVAGRTTFYFSMGVPVIEVIASEHAHTHAMGMPSGDPDIEPI